MATSAVSHLPKRYTRPCKHQHVSGRKCATRVPRKDAYGKPVKFCDLHRTDGCLECDSMMRAFGLLPEN